MVLALLRWGDRGELAAVGCAGPAGTRPGNYLGFFLLYLKIPYRENESN